jgi:hypothetical protein
MPKTYEDLPPQEETELVLWLGFFEDSVHNAHTQMKRWKHLKSGWDLHMFFVAVVHVDDAAKGLERFLSYDADVWAILKEFREKVKEYNLRDLRNDIVHRERIFRLQDKKGNPLPESPILLLGAYDVSRDEYSFGTHRVKISQTFDLINAMTEDIKRALTNRLTEFYKTENLAGMIPFTYLHSFARDSSGEYSTDTS